MMTPHRPILRPILRRTSPFGGAAPVTRSPGVAVARALLRTKPRASSKVNLEVVAGDVDVAIVDVVARSPQSTDNQPPQRDVRRPQDLVLPAQVAHALQVSKKLCLGSHKLPLYKRLGQSLPLWVLIKADEWVIQVVSQGYMPMFKSPPPLTWEPMWFTVSPELAPSLVSEIEGMLKKEAIEIVTNQRSRGFYSRMFIVPKKNGKLRPIIDLSPLNEYIAVPKFKMLTTRLLSCVLPQGHWAASLDLKDAYFHIPMSRSF